AYEVATRYAEGRGAPQNFKAAAAWYERAARGGLAPALFRLGALYEKGNGVPKNLTEARRLYLAAAEKGNANAMHNIGVLYAEGIDGKPDSEEKYGRLLRGGYRRQAQLQGGVGFFPQAREPRHRRQPVQSGGAL